MPHATKPPAFNNKIRGFALLAMLPIVPIWLAACHPVSLSRPGLAANDRFSRIDKYGAPSAHNQPWHCVFDRGRQLLWEVKSQQPGLHGINNRYTWYNRVSGKANGGDCQGSACDTHAYIEQLNNQRYCGSAWWRLPSREELRSLLRYEKTFPGPTIDNVLFPNTLSQFYWSQNSDSQDKDSAWGIGFSFGYDYSYLKIHAAPVRAVSADPALARRTFKPDNSTVAQTGPALIWSRCSWGQQFQHNTCRGDALALSFAQAQQIAEQQRVKTGKAWRIPSLMELAGIVDLGANHPAIDGKLFPHTQPDNYWSATPFSNDPKQQWQINMISGGNVVNPRLSNAYLRLVYTADKASIK